jgi:phosphatidylglycerophosphatase A
MNLRLALLTVFGLGRLRPAPGTWGSLPAVVVALLCVWLFDPGAGAPEGGDHGTIYANITIALLGLAFAIACLKFGAEGEARFGGKDAQAIVADEVAGQSIALLALPWRSFSDAGAMGWNLSLAVIAFVAFRGMDIAKPPPARAMQSMRGGLGIVIDDVIAGIYALMISQVIARLLLPRLIG